MSSVPTAEELATSARWLVQALDAASGMARVIEMDREAYRAASFLDDRMLQQPVNTQILLWRDIASTVSAEARSDARWIFHIGHVGSTLLARLLGELPGVLSVREPRILRDLAMLPPQQRREFAPVVARLLSRTFAPPETALVKATSFVTEIAPELVTEGGRALFLHASPAAYVATILAGTNSRVELAHFAEPRRQRLASRGISLEGADRSDAHRAAAGWACEMTALETAANAMPDRRLMWMDFDRFLSDVPGSLAAAAEVFGFPAEPEQLRQLAAGPLMRRYSKALEYDYGPDLRRELLDEAAQAYRAHIDSALAMLHRAAEKSPLLERSLERAQAES